MKLTLTVFHQDTGDRLYADTYHLPNDLVESLGGRGGREPPQPWGGQSPHDMHINVLGLGTDERGQVSLDPLRLEYRFTANPCFCLTCRIPAADTDSWGPR